MADLFRKELRLSASLLSYLFIAFGLMYLLPGYPVNCGAFFVTLGIYQSYRNTREANDLVFSALLPISKRDVVRGKYLFTVFIELCGFVVMALCALLRNTVLVNSPTYRANALMNANLFALAVALVIFGLFNAIFVCGFFKPGFGFGKPFILYAVTAFLVIGLSEALHYFPGLSDLNAFGFEKLPLRLALLTAGLLCFALLTLLSMKRACRRFETIDF